MTLLSSKWIALGLCALGTLLAATAVRADEPKAATADAAKTVIGAANDDQQPATRQEVKDAAQAGNNAWMLTSSALVLFMTAPGLAMFYGGLVRKKNVLGVMMQCIFLMAMLTVVWGLYGYSLAFGGEGPYVGNADYVAMRGVQPHYDEATKKVITPQEGKIPRLTHMLFQGMFFIITPALICGAFAERMKFSAMVVFTLLWGTLVYCPLCHWVWSTKGILYYGGPNAWAGGALDFAGGTVVHISSGVSALVCALFVGRRMGFGSEDMRPHNLTFTALGAAMLWVGWFGFNAGSALASNDLAASAFTATHFAAAAGGVSWSIVEWIARGKASLLGAASGVVAGLVCITPASGYVQPMSALLIGAAGGLVCYFACSSLKAKFRYDDALDAFGVHGVGGTLGAVLTGIFATRAVNIDAGQGSPLGLLEQGNSLVGQLVATGVTWVFAGVATFVLLKLVDSTIGLRVKKEQEMVGLDISQHGEEGYIFV